MSLDPSELAELEGEAGALLQRAGAADDEVPEVRALCVALLGTPPRMSSVPRGDAVLVRIHDDWQVWVRRGLAVGRARWAIGHELAHYWLEHRLGVRDGRIEDFCDALGAAIVVPRRAYLRALRSCGLEVHALATALRTTQSVVLLRHGEAGGHPVALVRQEGILVRGEEWTWPTESALRRAAKRGAPGLARVAIDDEPRRTGLVVEE